MRDEGYRITLTYKYKDTKSKFSNENEIIIDNFDAAVNILHGLGCQTKYYYEKLREIWNVKNSEIIFDINPGTSERMEIESPTLQELNNLTKKLGLLDFKIDRKSPSTTFELFGFNIPNNLQTLTFRNVKKKLLPLVTKNKLEFIKLIKDQKDLYKKILQKSNS